METDLPNPKALFVLSLLGGASVCAILFVTLSASAIPKPPPAPYPKEISLAPELLTAQSAVLYDPKDGRILFEKNPDAQLPLASLTKLMAAAAVLSDSPEDAVVAIHPNDLKPSGDWNFRAGEEWRLSQLLAFALVASSNDAITAAATGAGGNIVDVMNRIAGNLGLTHTYFLNPTGLDVDRTMPGAYGSAKDMALLAAVFMREYPSLFEATSKPNVSISFDNHTLTASSTAAPLLSIPGFVGAKTGFTPLAGGNLVAVFDLDLGHPLIAVVLGSTYDGRFEDIRTLITAAREQQQL